MYVIKTHSVELTFRIRNAVAAIFSKRIAYLHKIFLFGNVGPYDAYGILSSQCCFSWSGSECSQL